LPYLPYRPRGHPKPYLNYLQACLMPIATEKAPDRGLEIFVDIYSNTRYFYLLDGFEI
jgi:hypothetical protein